MWKIKSYSKGEEEFQEIEKRLLEGIKPLYQINWIIIGRRLKSRNACVIDFPEPLEEECAIKYDLPVAIKVAYPMLIKLLITVLR